MPSGVTFHLIRSSAELRAAVPRWTALWRDDPQASPFQSPEWLVPWWNHLGQGELRSIVIARDGVWIGFLPFYLYRDPYTGERQLLPLGVSATDYLDGIFAPSCSASQIREALAVLLHGSGWEVFYASQLPPHSRLFHAVRMMPEGRFQQFEAESCSRMRAVSLAELPQKTRRDAICYRNRAQRAGSLELRMADGTNWAESFGALRRLYSERWLEHRETDLLAEEQILNWHCEALPLLEKSGLLRLSALRLNGEIIGVNYSLIDPYWRPVRTQYFYLTSFSTQHSDLRPGTLLLALAIERAAREGVEIVDLLRGNETYKQSWPLEWIPTRGIALEYAAEALVSDVQKAA